MSKNAPIYVKYNTILTNCQYKMSLIPPKEALEISKNGKNAQFEAFKRAFTEVYNAKVRKTGFTFPMNIYLDEIQERNRTLESIHLDDMEHMIRTILAEHTDSSIKVHVVSVCDLKDGSAWVSIRVEECTFT
jgi:hypothetical protein